VLVFDDKKALHVIINRLSFAQVDDRSSPVRDEVPTPLGLAIFPWSAMLFTSRVSHAAIGLSAEACAMLVRVRERVGLAAPPG